MTKDFVSPTIVQFRMPEVCYYYFVVIFIGVIIVITTTTTFLLSINRTRELVSDRFVMLAREGNIKMERKEGKKGRKKRREENGSRDITASQMHCRGSPVSIQTIHQ